jgi:hypothetical protein
MLAAVLTAKFSSGDKVREAEVPEVIRTTRLELVDQNSKTSHLAHFSIGD